MQGELQWGGYQVRSSGLLGTLMLPFARAPPFLQRRLSVQWTRRSRTLISLMWSSEGQELKPRIPGHVRGARNLPEASPLRSGAPPPGHVPLSRDPKENQVVLKPRPVTADDRYPWGACAGSYDRLQPANRMPGVRDGAYQNPARAQYPGAFAQGNRRLVHVLKDARGDDSVEGGRREGQPAPSRVKLDPLNGAGGVLGSCGAQHQFGDVASRHLPPRSGGRTGYLASTAPEIEHPAAGGSVPVEDRGEKTQPSGETSARGVPGGPGPGAGVEQALHLVNVLRGMVNHGSHTVPGREA